MGSGLRPSIGGNVFREPLRRDPLIVCWVLVMLVAGFVALSNNTTWSGHLEADRVAGFLKDIVEAFLWSFLLLLLAAWLRARGWRDTPRAAPRGSGRSAASRERFAPYPWTDRWLRDWREADAQRRTSPAPAEPSDDGLPMPCRHGVPVDMPVRVEQVPVLRALSVSHPVVRPGASVSVTWCFEHCTEVVVDGRPGYPSCGEALARIDRTRRIEVVGRNRYGSTPVATASVVAVAVPQLNLPTVESPPPVALRTDVAATVGGATPVTQRLDDFWATQDSLRPRLDAPPRLVGVPASLIESLRRARRSEQES
jgi:hypothetical protein